MSEQLFVEGRCDFRQENRIIRVLIKLVPLRKPGVHGMARFVREGENIREDVALVVHQNIRRRAIATGREGAAPFSFRFVAVAPAPAQTRA